jgi:hypothetical protein
MLLLLSKIIACPAFTLISPLTCNGLAGLDVPIPNLLLVLFQNKPALEVPNETEPLTVKLPVGTTTVPYNVWVSLALSPNVLEPVELIVVLICNTLIDAVPNTITSPDTTADDIVVAPVIVALPENIAGPMFVKVEDPDTRNDPDTCKLLVVAQILPLTLLKGCVEPEGPATPCGPVEPCGPGLFITIVRIILLLGYLS